MWGRPMTRVALFDVAGTVVSGNPWRGFLAYDGMDKWRVYRRYPVFAPPYWAKKAGLISDVRFRQIWVREMAALLRGMHRERTDDLFCWIAEDFMADCYQEDVVARLREHKQNGDFVLLVSGMFTPLTQAFADAVGADAGVGTGLAFDDAGICTGKIVGAVCAGERKPLVAEQTLRAHGIDPRNAETHAYADSFSDVPLLAFAQHATATHPEEKLLTEVAARGWATIG